MNRALPPTPASRRVAWRGVAALVLVVVGLSLWPLRPAPEAASPVPADAGVGAPAPPVLHAVGAVSSAAAGTSPDPAPPARATGAAGAAPHANRPIVARVPAARSLAQAILGRWNLEGG